VTLLGGGASAGPARADRVVADGIEFKDAVVLRADPDAGKLHFRFRDGRLSRAIDPEMIVELDRYPAMARATAALEAGRAAEAADLLAGVRWTDRDRWVEGIIRIAQQRAWRRAGRFDKAVASWLGWLKLGWARPEIPPPADLPAAGSPPLAEAIRAIETALAELPESRRPAAAALLGRLRDRAGGKDADRIAAPAPDDYMEALEETDRKLLAALNRRLAGRQYDAGLADARRSVRGISRGALPLFCLLVGRLFEGKGDLPRAGLAYMRVLVHFPTDRFAPAAMLGVGRIHEGLGRKDIARRVYGDMARGRYGRTTEADAARKALNRLGE
jgi:tetratricopeptide (TPR) repeat protein